MENDNPFDQDKIYQIFSVSGTNSHLISRESSSLEFKLSFGWNSMPQYMKTCAAFANNKGGYIIFGVSNKPHRLVGLQPVPLQLFDTIDGAQITESFNNHFAPEIKWEHETFELEGRMYGLLYIHESTEKPVVCIKNNSDDLKEGDILYRYRARSQRIKYSELRAILEQMRKNEQEIWMNHLSRIAKIGVENTGIFNISSGEVTWKSGNSFIIDESLLSQLSFIKEGEFNEIKGKPTLRLIGNVEPVENIPLTLGGKQVVKVPIKGIRQPDIILGFLAQQPVQTPKDYITQICHESTAMLPIYYYMHLGRLDENQTIEILSSVISRSPAKKRIIERVKERTLHALPMSKNLNTEISKNKIECIGKFLNNQVVAYFGVKKPPFRSKPAGLSEQSRPPFRTKSATP